MQTPLSFVATLVFILGVGFGAEAQAAVPSLVVDCGGVFDLCGYRDTVTNRRIIPRQFESAAAFSEGLAAIRLKDRYGYVDQDGRVAIQPTFDFAGPFYQGLAEVFVDGNAGVIDRSGAIVVKPLFSRAVPFTSRTVLVDSNARRFHGPFLAGYFSPRGLQFWNYDLSFDGATWGIYDVRQAWLTRPVYRIKTFESEGRGLIWAATEKGPFGLLRHDGHWQVNPQYDRVQRLDGDTAIVGTASRQRISFGLDAYNWGKVDQDGRLAIPLQPGYFVNQRDTLRSISREGKIALVDTQRNMVGGHLFDAVRPALHDGQTYRVLSDGKWAGLSADGQLVADPDENAVLATCPSGMKLIVHVGAVQFIGVDGKPLTDHLFDREQTDLTCDAPSRVRLDGKWSFLTSHGDLLVDPPCFDEVRDFLDGVAPVRQGWKWGLLNDQGKLTVPPRFDSLVPAGDGSYRVQTGTRIYWISSIGQEVPAPVPTPQSYSRTSDWDCSKGTRFIEHEGQWGLADGEGQTIIPPRYRAVRCFKSGLAWIADDERRLWCPIGPDGAVRDRPACVQSLYIIRLISGMTAEKYSEDAYESSVLWMRAFLDWQAGRGAMPQVLGQVF